MESCLPWIGVPTVSREKMAELEKLINVCEDESDIDVTENER